MARTKAQLQAYVQLQAACSRVAYSQREFQLTCARLTCAVELASREGSNNPEYDITYLAHRRDHTQDRYMATVRRLNNIVATIAVLFETSKLIQPQCLKLIYFAYPTMYVPRADQDLDDWFDDVCEQVNVEISTGIVREIDELNRCIHAAVDVKNQ